MAPTYHHGPLDGHVSRRLRRLHFTLSARFMSLASIQSAKVELRRSALSARNSLPDERKTEAAHAVAARVNQIPGLRAGQTIAGYWPLGSEIDCRPALTAIGASGCRLVLPVAGHRGDRLLFRVWEPGKKLESGPFGTSHPPASAIVLEPDILLVPLLAFDRQGNRLGYGAAYYDRTLAALRPSRPVTAWGFAFDEQEVAEVPAEPTDQKLDGVITDRRLLRFGETR